MSNALNFDGLAVRAQPRRQSLRLARVLGLFDLWERRLYTRRQLRELDDSLLRDIGIDRVEALREANKPFWRA